MNLCIFVFSKIPFSIGKQKKNVAGPQRGGGGKGVASWLLLHKDSYVNNDKKNLIQLHNFFFFLYTFDSHSALKILIRLWRSLSRPMYINIYLGTFISTYIIIDGVLYPDLEP